MLISDLESDRRAGRSSGNRLCETCVEVLDVSGAGIMLMTDGEHRGTFGVSNATISVVEELQFTLGEGPCIDAFNTKQPVFEPNLVEPNVNRWPAFSGPAVAAGVGAVFGFPLISATPPLGALDIYLHQPGDLDADQVTDAIALAAVIATSVLALQADALPGMLAPEIDSSLDHRAVVHQASGMVSAQLDIGVGSALARIRAHAYTESRAINDVAREILNRQLLLD